MTAAAPYSLIRFIRESSHFYQKHGIVVISLPETVTRFYP